MQDKLLLIIIILCLGFGGYKLITRILVSPAASSAQTADISPAQKTAETAVQENTPTPSPADAVTNQPAAVASEPPPDDLKPPETQPLPEIQPPKISRSELTQHYKINGIAAGNTGSMVIVNQTPLYEGESLGELTVEKIREDYIEVSYQGNSYQLPAQVF